MHNAESAIIRLKSEIFQGQNDPKYAAKFSVTIFAWTKISCAVNALALQSRGLNPSKNIFLHSFWSQVTSKPTPNKDELFTALVEEWNVLHPS